MTAEEYYAIADPTNKDHEAWTRSFFARIDRAIKRSEKYLSEITKED